MEETEFEKWHRKEGVEYRIVAAIEADRSLPALPFKISM